MISHSTASQFKLPADKTMLDVVTYIASLVSKSNEIDPQLDRVRAITSQRSAGELTKQDNHELREVYDYLENYLVTKESLRSFTKDSLHEKIQNYLTGAPKSNSLKKSLAIMWAIAIGASLSAFLVPDSLMAINVKATFAIVIFFATIHLGAAWMFWVGLKNFKDKIRRAYLPICIGISLVGITLLQVPIAVMIGQDTSSWFRYITSSLPIPIAETLIYIGICRFATIGGVKSKFLSGKLVFGICMAVAIVVNILPRPDPAVPYWVLTTSLSILTTGAIIAAVAAWITTIVRRRLSQAYKQPMAWFIASLLISTYTSAQYAVLQLIATHSHPFNPQGLALVSIVVSGFIVLKAGISFRQIDTITPRTNS